MATPAQILANRANAQSSTGPVTAEGKSRCSRNAVATGLFSKGDFVLDDEREDYAQFCAAYEADLTPEGAIEHTLAAEIIHAAWRLRRCSRIEAEIDPYDDEEELAETERSLDRARANAHRIFNRSMAELRRIQTERHLRAKLPAQTDLGVANCKEIDGFRKLTPRFDEEFLKEWIAVDSRLTLRQTPESDFAKQTQSGPEPAPLTPRGAPCPCNSGQKYKRCCGKEAPPVLTRAA
jgi:hypothetical protein